MSERFIKFIPSEEAMYLVIKKGHAFRLLTIIAELARRYEGAPDGLHIGEALLGDWKSYGMTEQNYRTAKKILVQRQHLEITETNRNRKKSTTGVTTEGTKVKLLSSNVYDINISEGNDRPNDCLTTDQRLPNDELRKNKNIKKEEESKVYAQSAAPLHTKENLFFNSESCLFEGISLEDRKDWVAMFPNVNLDLEITKATQWLKSNPSKSKKKLWRKFLTGWFSRANDYAENKKAFKANFPKASVERGTKNMDGTPMKSKAEGLF